MLEVENLKKHFGAVKAVDGCSFEVEKGKITALIGPNGAGKSTVFNLVSGILDQDSGEIYFKDERIDSMAPETRSNMGVSRLYQEERLFNNLTVENNLVLSLDNEDTRFWSNLLGFNSVTDSEREDIREHLSMFDMEKLMDQKASELSYGQKRLVELSRALLRDHDFLMLDEPVAGVNPRLRDEITEILKEQREDGNTILLIEHDMEFTLEIADHVIVMDEGRVIAEGEPDHIKENEKVLDAYLGN